MTITPNIEVITYEEILDLWTRELWPNRGSGIRPLSSITKELTYNMQIHEHSTPTFIGIRRNNKLIGVCSGFHTLDLSYRTRGLYIKPEYRKQGLATQLIKNLENVAKKEGCKSMWSLPRENAIKTYLNAGFVKKKKVPELMMEFGPNWLVEKKFS